VFDYSPAWVRKSVHRSCQRLNTSYLDVVYCHDCEYVSSTEVLEAIRELRRIRDATGTVKYVGISAYPVDVLCELAEMILRETGEPVDIVQSYANYTVQNTRLLSQGLDRLTKAGVDVVTNASPLSMGLLRSAGPPVGAMGGWHPAPDGLRQRCLDASAWLESKGEKLEVVAVRFALETWLREGAQVGTLGQPIGSKDMTNTHSRHGKLGVSVMGVSKVEELDETMRVWRSVVDGLPNTTDDTTDPSTPSDATTDHEQALKRCQTVRELVDEIRKIIGPEWIDYAWPSPDSSFVRKDAPKDAAKESAVLRNSMLTPPESEADNK
jgi:hypothetical protein